MRGYWSRAAENAGDQGWLSPAGEKRLRTGLSAARCQIRGPGAGTGGASRSAGPLLPEPPAQPPQPSSALAPSLARVRSRARTRQEKPFVS